MYALALALGHYRHLVGLGTLVPDNVSALFNRYGPFYGTMFIALGAFVRTHELRFSTATLTIGTLVAALLLLGEARLASAQGGQPFAIGFRISTIPYAVFGFLAIKAIMTKFGSARLADLGRLSLGMYCVHALFVIFAQRLIGYNDGEPELGHILADAGAAIAVVGLSIFVALTLKRSRLLARVVYSGPSPTPDRQPAAHSMPGV